MCIDWLATFYDFLKLNKPRGTKDHWRSRSILYYTFDNEHLNKKQIIIYTRRFITYQVLFKKKTTKYFSKFSDKKLFLVSRQKCLSEENNVAAFFWGGGPPWSTIIKADFQTAKNIIAGWKRKQEHYYHLSTVQAGSFLPKSSSHEII